jgi:hypothetical protein
MSFTFHLHGALSLKNVLELTRYFIKKNTFYNIQIMRKNRPNTQRQICKELHIKSGYLTLINFDCSQNYFIKHPMDNLMMEGQLSLGGGVCVSGVPDLWEL